MSAAREIGGYLEFERFRGSLYHDGAVRLSSGRACLEYVIELRGINAIWLPDLLCSSVSGLCSRKGVRILTYAVDERFRPEEGVDVGRGEWLYLVDYYGTLDGADVARGLEVSRGKLIVDESQGFFRRPWEGVDTLYTCRKWFGVADGAFLWTHDGAELNRTLPAGESHARMGFVLGRLERPASAFLGEARANNARFAEEPMSAMSPVTESILRAVDYCEARQARERNWADLHEALGASNLLKVATSEGPFMYPYLVDDARGVRERMAERGVYIPTLWPNVLAGRPRGSVAWGYAQNILPLPVDQRYGAEEMKKVAEVLVECLN